MLDNWLDESESNLYILTVAKTEDRLKVREEETL